MEAICNKCRHLRDTRSENPEAHEAYRACGYPEPAVPAALAWPAIV